MKTFFLVEFEILKMTSVYSQEGFTMRTGAIKGKGIVHSHIKLHDFLRGLGKPDLGELC